MCRLICFEANPRARPHFCKTQGFQHLLKAFGGLAHFLGMSIAFFLKMNILKDVLLIVFPTTKPDLVTEIYTENNLCSLTETHSILYYVVQSAKYCFSFTSISDCVLEFCSIVAYFIVISRSADIQM